LLPHRKASSSPSAYLFHRRKDYIKYCYEEELEITITSSLHPIDFPVDFFIGFPIDFVAGSSVAAVALTAAALEEALEEALEVLSCSGRLRIFADCLRSFADCGLIMTKWNEDLYI